MARLSQNDCFVDNAVKLRKAHPLLRCSDVHVFEIKTFSENSNPTVKVLMLH